MLRSLKAATVSVLHITEKDWNLLCELASKDTSLCDTETEAYLRFCYFEPDYSVNVSVGRVFLDPKDDVHLDADLYKLIINKGLSTHFADLIMQARREEFNYLVFDPDESPSKDKETFW